MRLRVFSNSESRVPCCPPCPAETAGQGWATTPFFLSDSGSVRGFSGVVSGGEFLLGYLIEELAECGLVFGEHPEELDAVAELRVAGDDLG